MFKIFITPANWIDLFLTEDITLKELEEWFIFRNLSYLPAYSLKISSRKEKHLPDYAVREEEEKWYPHSKRMRYYDESGNIVYVHIETIIGTQEIEVHILKLEESGYRVRVWGQTLPEGRMDFRVTE